MEHTFESIKEISIEELQYAIEKVVWAPKLLLTTEKLALVDIFYLMNKNPYQEQISKEDKRSIQQNLINAESRLKYMPCSPLCHNPYLLTINICLADFYIEQKVFSEYWLKVKKMLYKNLIGIHGHNMDSISMVSFYGLCMAIRKKQGYSENFIRRWTAQEFPKLALNDIGNYYLDELDIFYLLQKHPEQERIPQEDRDFIYAHLREKEVDLFAKHIAAEGVSENEYQLWKKYLYLKLCFDGEYENLCDIYRDILNEDYQAGIMD